MAIQYKTAKHGTHNLYNRPGLFYSSPMATVTGHRLAGEMIRLGHVPVVSRKLLEQHKYEYHQSLIDFGQYAVFAVGPSDADIHAFINIMDRLKNEKKIPEAAEVDVCIDSFYTSEEDLQRIGELLKENTHVDTLISPTLVFGSCAKIAMSAGFNGIRVGYGNGHCSKLLERTGIQTDLYSEIRIAQRHIIESGCETHFIIADGGISTGADVVECLVAGAQGIMMGTALAKTDESMGWRLEVDLDQAIFDPREKHTIQKKWHFGTFNDFSEELIRRPDGPTVESVINHLEADVKLARQILTPVN